MSEPTKCARCPRMEVIDTLQHIRVHGDDIFFCERCWEEFCAWRYGWPCYKVEERHDGSR